jgi:glycosyltransferase involved in cell wall biosynthesis
MANQRDHICICICTYKRTELLRQLLKCLQEQRTDGLFDYSIVVIDNDSQMSGKTVIGEWERNSSININYYIEPERGISLARNRAVKMAKGDFLALIDDDEIPTADWLISLYRAIGANKADGVLGPVLPYFSIKPAKWILKGNFFDRKRYKTGKVMHWRETRTGNALIKKEVLVLMVWHLIPNLK